MNTETKALVGVLGPLGSNGDFAMRLFKDRFSFLSDCAVEYFDAHADLLEALEADEITHGVVPIENTTNHGLVGDVIDFWSDAPRAAHVIAEQWEDIKHCLMVPNGISDSLPNLCKHIVVLSKAEALMQCRKTLSKLGISSSAQQKVVSSTAEAARIVSTSHASNYLAAVASRYAAETYGLQVVRANINDKGDNATRFHLVASPKTGGIEHSAMNKKALIFKVEDVPGAFDAVSHIFKVFNMNMTCMKSLPTGSKQDYNFYVEVVRSPLEKNWPSEFMDQLTRSTAWVRCIGTFEEHVRSVDV